MKQEVKLRSNTDWYYLKKWGLHLEPDLEYSDNLMSLIKRFIFENSDFQAFKSFSTVYDNWENKVILEGLKILCQEQGLQSFEAVAAYFSMKKKFLK